MTGGTRILPCPWRDASPGGDAEAHRQTVHRALAAGR